MFLEKNILQIYTDGSSYSRPRRGGYAARFVYLNDLNQEVTEDFEYPGHRGATNNQMELLGCIRGLDEAKRFVHLDRIRDIVILTDSMYVSENYRNALFSWPKNRWMGREGPILNVSLWKNLVKRIKHLKLSRVHVRFQWVKGHSKDKHNRAVDKMAKKSAQNCVQKSLSEVAVRRKQFVGISNPQTMKACGQKFTIKIFTCEYLREQRIYKYKYEVVSKRSAHYKRTGIIYFKELLPTRNSYLVTLSSRLDQPFIEKVHRVYGE